jgi:WD40 repeat protein
VSHAAFSFDGRSVVTASVDMTARLWSADDGRGIFDPMPQVRRDAEIRFVRKYALHIRILPRRFRQESGSDFDCQRRMVSG